MDRLSSLALSLAGGERQLPCGDDFKKHVVHLDSGSAIHCTLRAHIWKFLLILQDRLLD